MLKILSVAVFALALGAGQAMAQSSGGGSSGGGSSAGTAGSSGTGGGATTMPGMGNSGGTGTVAPGTGVDPGTTGSTSTQNESNGRPTQAQCKGGWTSTMKWSQSEFKSLCGS
ncbi:MAG TPA: hypothetical protein VH858_00300 [Hyphomicrobiales bacterium]|jgi:hypothetical protein